MFAYFKSCELAAKRLLKENYLFHASALSYATLLSLVPLIALIVFFISNFPIFDRITGLARDYIIGNFLPASSDTIQMYLFNFIQQASALPLFGFIFLFFISMMLLLTIDNALNVIWHLPRRRIGLSHLIIYPILLMLFPIALGCSVFITFTFFSFSWVVYVTTTLHIKAFIIIFIPLLTNTIIFTLIYKFVPRTLVLWKNALWGGFVASILFEMTKFLFPTYTSQFSAYNFIYGALALIPVFLLWLYVIWVIILYGALVSCASQKRS